jgi:hypothetical protein
VYLSIFLRLLLSLSILEDCHIEWLNVGKFNGSIESTFQKQDKLAFAV